MTDCVFKESFLIWGKMVYSETHKCRVPSGYVCMWCLNAHRRGYKGGKEGWTKEMILVDLQKPDRRERFEQIRGAVLSRFTVATSSPWRTAACADGRWSTAACSS